MMNSCATVQDAIDLFRSAGTVNPPFSVLLADAGGGPVMKTLRIIRFALRIVWTSSCICRLSQDAVDLSP